MPRKVRSRQSALVPGRASEAKKASANHDTDKGWFKKKRESWQHPQPKVLHQRPSCHVAGPSSLKAPYLTWGSNQRQALGGPREATHVLWPFANAIPSARNAPWPPPLQPLCLAQGPHHLGLTSQWSVCLLGGCPLRAGILAFYQHLSGASCSVYLERAGIENRCWIFLLLNNNLPGLAAIGVCFSNSKYPRHHSTFSSPKLQNSIHKWVKFDIFDLP